MGKRISLTLAAMICIGLADDTPPPGFLRPLDQTVVPAGPMAVVARTSGKAELRLDGKPAPSSQPAPNALTATMNLPPGRHELTLVNGGKEQKVQFFVRTAANAATAPQGWGEFHTHPPAATCDTCHAVKEGVWSFKSDNLGDSCFGCHEAGKKFAETHSHNPETLAECNLCHRPHGSAVPAHLKMKKEVACKQCHS